MDSITDAIQSRSDHEAGRVKENETGIATEPLDAFQVSVASWVVECLGQTRGADRAERAQRALEEAIELAQACGCPEEDAIALVRYVYARPAGTVAQEVGGVMVTSPRSAKRLTSPSAPPPQPN